MPEILSVCLKALSQAQTHQVSETTCISTRVGFSSHACTSYIHFYHVCLFVQELFSRTMVKVLDLQVANVRLQL